MKMARPGMTSSLRENVSSRSLYDNRIVWIQLEKDGRMIGFKFVLPSNFPLVPPWSILDEPVNPMVSEFIDYVGSNNVLNFAYQE
jgi:hypothetical protein